MEKFIKKYKWWVIGAAGAFLVWHIILKRAFIAGDPTTGMAGKDTFHLYCTCKMDPSCPIPGMPCLMGRCVHEDGTSAQGHPCQGLGVLDTALPVTNRMKGGEDIRVNPMVML